jgi:hypothetical protein
MTTITNFITTKYLSSSSYGTIIGGISVLVIALLIVLLVEKVLLDAYEGNPKEKQTITFTVVILPLIFALVITSILRIAQVLHL